MERHESEMKGQDCKEGEREVKNAPVSWCHVQATT